MKAVNIVSYILLLGAAEASLREATRLLRLYPGRALHSPGLHTPLETGGEYGFLLMCRDSYKRRRGPLEVMNQPERERSAPDGEDDSFRP